MNNHCSERKVEKDDEEFESQHHGSITDSRDDVSKMSSIDVMMQEANRVYLSVVNTFTTGATDLSMLLNETDPMSRRYRGLLLGWLGTEGASVQDLVTGRLQHDVGYSEIVFQLDTYESNMTLSPRLSTKDILNELSKTVALLLKSFPGEEQLKFMFGTKVICQNVVAALFNVGRRNNIRICDFGIEYLTRVKMITQCLAWCLSNKRVSIKIAKQAYTKFVGDPTGDRSEPINLKMATQLFGKHIKHSILMNEIGRAHV